MVGELIVVHEITMAAAVANLKRILAVFGNWKVFIITPLLRFINVACWGEASHCTHRLIPDAAMKLLLDLIRLHKFIEGRLSSFPSCEVIPGGRPSRRQAWSHSERGPGGLLKLGGSSRQRRLLHQNGADPCGQGPFRNPSKSHRFSKYGDRPSGSASGVRSGSGSGSSGGFRSRY